MRTKVRVVRSQVHGDAIHVEYVEEGDNNPHQVSFSHDEFVLGMLRDVNADPELVNRAVCVAIAKDIASRRRLEAIRRERAAVAKALTALQPEFEI